MRKLLMAAAMIALASPTLADSLRLHVIEAQPIADTDYGGGMVLVRLSPDSAREFAQFTRENIKKHIAIIVDGEVRLAPFIQGPIVGNSFPITGLDSVDEATEMAQRLSSGQSTLTAAPHEVDAR